jgi:glycosyltransferase involved in cell wall biosynthesis
MLSQWRWPKDPFVAIRAFAESTSRSRLKIAGYGEQWEAVEKLIGELNIAHRVDLIGRVDSGTAMQLMTNALAFLHPSEYETFSVVCAEALCCGTPVVASAVGGIPSFVNETNGILISDHEVASWRQAIGRMETSVTAMNREDIASTARSRFGKNAVGALYAGILQDVYQSFRSKNK